LLKTIITHKRRLELYEIFVVRQALELDRTCKVLKQRRSVLVITVKLHFGLGRFVFTDARGTHGRRLRIHVHGALHIVIVVRVDVGRHRVAGHDTGHVEQVVNSANSKSYPQSCPTCNEITICNLSNLRMQMGCRVIKRESCRRQNLFLFRLYDCM